MRCLISLFAIAVACDAQWTIQRSNTTADLRGIDSIGHGVAWASGTNGTILRTVDAGETWQRCAVPLGAEHLDFRGIQGISGGAAIAMSAGPGDLSRVYETHDGCRTWELQIANPDREGFWDAILYDPQERETFVLGDPVQGAFVLNLHGHGTWRRERIPSVVGQAGFAASNSILIKYQRRVCFVTGGSRAEFVCNNKRYQLPFKAGESSGAFSIATHASNVVIVGGDYKHPADGAGTAAFSVDSGKTFSAAKAMPNGYRSAVAYDAQRGMWIAVGPDGTDLSRNGGRDWFSAPSQNKDAPDSGKNWNALSPPFAAGPHGRIGRLNLEGLMPR